MMGHCYWLLVALLSCCMGSSGNQSVVNFNEVEPINTFAPQIAMKKTDLHILPRSNEFHRLLASLSDTFFESTPSEEGKFWKLVSKLGRKFDDTLTLHT